MDVNRMEARDLKYELRIRGIHELDDEEQMKKLLKKFVGLELETGVSLIKEKINVKEEEDECRSKIVDLRNEINEFSGRYTDGRYKKISARISYMLKRLERLSIDSVHKESLITEANDLYIFLDIKSGKPSASKEGRNTEETTEFVLIKDPPSSSSSSSSAPTKKQRPYIPVSDWKLVKYTADNPRVSLGQFLQNVEDKRLARNVDKEELFESAADLFEGTALVYYRYIKKRVHSWPELVEKFKDVFQGPYYDERLMEEIKERKQGPNEPITIYLAKMDNYFQRLNEPPSEKNKLMIIERNLHPFFLKHLSHVEYNTLLELEEIGKKLERGKKLAEGFNRASRDVKLESDLQYRNPGLRYKTPGANLNQKVTCWYCHRPGHRYQDCDQNDNNPDV